jgi:hypothetical protein
MGMRLAWRSFQAATRRSASWNTWAPDARLRAAFRVSRGLPIGFHLPAAETHSEWLRGGRLSQRRPVLSGAENGNFAWMEQFVQMSALYSHMHFWAWSSHVFEGLLREPLPTQEVRLASVGIRAQSRQVHGERRRGALGPLRTPPASGVHIGTTGHRVSDQQSRVPALVSTDHSRAIWKNRETRKSSRRRPCEPMSFRPMSQQPSR